MNSETPGNAEGPASRVGQPNPTRPFADTATLYNEAGWHPIPVGNRPNEKSPVPEGFTGREAMIPSGADIYGWTEDKPDFNIGIRAPAGVVGIDVDAYVKGGRMKRGADTLEAIEASHGPLPTTPTSSARDGVSGIRWFRIPAQHAGVELRDPGGDIELVQHHHRYGVVWPSTNPDADNAVYRWRHLPNGQPVPDIGDLAFLPDGWVDHLARRCDCGSRSDHDDGLKLEVKTGNPLDDIHAKWAQAMATGSRHEATRDAVMALVGAVKAGWPEALETLQAVRSGFLDAVKGDRGYMKAVTEWDRLYDGALTKTDPWERWAPGQHDDAHPSSEPRWAFQSGLTVFDAAEPNPIWGDGLTSLWEHGQGLMPYAQTGVGKTTLMNLLIAGMIGIPGFETLLGYPIKPIPDGKTVLVVAADRPDQWRMAFARLVSRELHGDLLAERLRAETHRRIRVTPSDTYAFRDAARDANAAAVFLDSRKDVAGDPTDSKESTAFNDGVQHVMADGIDLCATHHARKFQQERRHKRLTIDDVYGSVWNTAGMGSVLALEGRPGEGIATLSQLKAPYGMLDELTVGIDYRTGRIDRRDTTDLLDFLRSRVGGATARQIAAWKYRVAEDDVTPAQKEKARKEVAGRTDVAVVREAGQEKYYGPALGGLG